nr:MAG TPA_asm: hypothetical protein [Bacteriophage sp.]
MTDNNVNYGSIQKCQNFKVLTPKTNRCKIKA